MKNKIVNFLKSIVAKIKRTAAKIVVRINSIPKHVKKEMLVCAISFIITVVFGRLSMKAAFTTYNGILVHANGVKDLGENIIGIVPAASDVRKWYRLYMAFSVIENTAMFYYMLSGLSLMARASILLHDWLQKFVSKFAKKTASNMDNNPANSYN